MRQTQRAQVGSSVANSISRPARRRGQAVEQRRLAGIGVADQATTHKHALPAGAMQSPRRPAPSQFVLQPRDALADQAAVSLDLGFAGTTHEAEATRWRSRWSRTAPAGCADS